MMNNFNCRNRFGKTAVTIVVLVVLIGVAFGASLGYSYSVGKEQQETQDRLWSQAFVYFSQKQPEAAYLKLIECRSTFSDCLNIYRKIVATESIRLTKSQINEAIILICQSEAYDNLFKLESADAWISKAKLEIENIEDGETRFELANFISRCEAANRFCNSYREYIKDPNLPEEKYKELVKNSLKVGSEAASSKDYDYAIFEIRFLIACGKSFEEPILVEEAAQQLVDVTDNYGEDEKTSLLWSLLTN